MIGKLSKRSTRSRAALLAPLVAALLATVLAAPLTAQAPDAGPPSAADFAWLAGDWVGRMGDGVIEETWSAPAAGTLVGMFRWTTERGVKLYELMSIEDGDAGPTLYLRHFSPGLEAWEEKDAPMVLELDLLGERSVSFLTTENGRSTRLTYRRTSQSRTDADGLEITLEQIEGAEKSSTTFVYRRR